MAPSKITVREAKVDTLTPTQIADAYMSSKVNSVRIALVRGYAVPEEERDLIESLITLPRSEAHRAFISYYSRGEYLPLNALNSTYEYSEEVDVIGTQPAYLSFVFYTSDGPDVEDLEIYDDSELVIVGLTDITQSGLLATMKALSDIKVRLVPRLAMDMALWPLLNPFVPKMKVYKKIADVDRFTRERGASSASEIMEILTNSVVALVYGMEVGDVMVEDGLLLDSSSLVKRRVTLRVAKDA